MKVTFVWADGSPSLVLEGVMPVGGQYVRFDEGSAFVTSAKYDFSSFVVPLAQVKYFTVDAEKDEEVEAFCQVYDPDNKYRTLHNPEPRNA